MDSDVRFRKLIENNYSGITLLNANFEITYRSPSSERITGWTTENRKLHPSAMELDDIIRDITDKTGVVDYRT